MFRSARLRIAALAAVLPLAILAGCLDGPLARENPFDPGSTLELRITGGADTLRTAWELVAFQLVSDPEVHDVTVEWSSSVDARLGALGGGRFIVRNLPCEPVDVEVLAQVGELIAVRTVTIVPEGW